jgi:hypothetical protein
MPTEDFDTAFLGLHKSSNKILTGKFDWRRELDVYGTLRDKVRLTKCSYRKEKCKGVAQGALFSTMILVDLHVIILLLIYYYYPFSHPY